MINPTGKKLQVIISKLIDGEIEGIDKYTLNGSTWLIFTDQKRWVVEYTEDGILWYNYTFFMEIFEILGMKATDNQNLIQEWFESKFLRPEVKHTFRLTTDKERGVEHTIQNGVKDTSFVNPYFNQNVEETIQNGVKDTQFRQIPMNYSIEDTIQNGVKETELHKGVRPSAVGDAIQNGVKRPLRAGGSLSKSVENTIQNGVKYT